MDWQPIETAPQGKAIVYDEKLGVIPNAYIWPQNKTATYGYYKNSAYNVTHWMPLPAPPVQS